MFVPEAYDKVWTAAAFNGESFTEVINRAVALYELITRSKPGTKITWVDTDNVTRKIKVQR